jgi:hypothetical protein
MGPTMDADLAFTTIKFCLSQIREKLEQAASIAKAADACSEAGNPEKAIEIALDVEQLIYEAGTLLNAASLLNRICET